MAHTVDCECSFISILTQRAQRRKGNRRISNDYIKPSTSFSFCTNPLLKVFGRPPRTFYTRQVKLVELYGANGSCWVVFKLLESYSYAFTILGVVWCTNIDSCAEKCKEDSCLE